MKPLMSDPILAHHIAAIKMVQASLRRRSDCCNKLIEEINDFDVCGGCGRPCSEEQ